MLIDLKKRLTDHPWGAVAALIVVICSCVYAPIFAGRVLFFRDLSRWIYPARHFVKRTLLHGEFPLWNPEVGLGFAVGSDPLYGLFYPGNWLYLLGSTVTATTVVGFLHLIWGALGMLCLARRCGVSPFAAALGALTWALCGSTTSWWTAGVLLNAAAWVPWCAHGMVGLAQSPKPSARLVANAAWPLMMSLCLGEVFVSMMAVGFGLAVCVALRMQSTAAPREHVEFNRRSGKAFVVRGVAMACALLLGVAGGAATLWPAISGSSDTPRGARLPREVAEVGSFHPWRLVELASPGVFGDPFDDYPGELVVGDELLSNRPLTDSAYAGAGALSLALFAFGRRRRLAGALGVCAILTLMIAMGRFTPLHQLFRSAVPPFAFLRYPEKYLIVFVPAVALLVCLGATELLRQRPTFVRAALPVLVLASLAAVCPWLMPPPVVKYFRPGVLSGALAFALMPTAIWALHSRPQLLRAAIMTLLTIDLAVAVWPIQRFAPPEILNTKPALATIISDDYARNHGAGHPRLFRSKQLEPLFALRMGAREAADVEFQSTQTLADNTSTVFGVSSVAGYDAAVPATFVDLSERGRRQVVAKQRLLSCDYLLAPRLPQWDELAKSAKLIVVAEPTPLARLYKIDNVLPRAYVAFAATYDNPAQAREHIFDEDVLRGERVWLSPARKDALVPSSPEPAHACRVDRFSTNSLSATCSAPRDGFAVFVEQFHKGWTATIDGEPTPVLQANLVMRAVALPAGTHTVTMQFNAPEMIEGVWASAAAGLVLLFLTMGAPRWIKRP
ncbi:MAG: hypothetical protein SF187_00430 [Deltaproteobacteria bacterium]|nr:hypothetical protein [Deltaproteobacteria bacterium]